MDKRLTSAASLLALLCTACITPPLDLVCTDIFRPAVVVRISDSVTARSAAYTASLILQNTTVYDSSYFGEDVGIAPATDTFAPFPLPNRTQLAGTYTVRVRRSGYAPWMRSAVVVPAERCGPIAVQLDARLQRAP